MEEYIAEYLKRIEDLKLDSIKLRPLARKIAAMARNLNNPNEGEICKILLSPTPNLEILEKIVRLFLEPHQQGEEHRLYLEILHDFTSNGGLLEQKTYDRFKTNLIGIDSNFFRDTTKKIIGIANHKIVF